MNPPSNVRKLLSPAEIHELTRRSNAAGFWAIGSTWAVVVGTFAALSRWPHPATFVAAVVVLGGRQLALAILMHEAAHRTLFANRILNDVVTDFLCARPVHGHVEKYRKHHLQHHAHTSTEKDPDLALVTPFPTTRRSLARKLTRDLLGATGIKRNIGLLMMDSEMLGYTVAGDAKRLPRNGRSAMD